jgi:CDP-glucose 4,6-dehydratase
MQSLINAYKGKNILITGHTGFKGSWLAIWLHELGANVIGYALDPYTEKDNFVLSKIGSKIVDIRGDIRDKNKLKEVFYKYKPEIIFHLAAQPLVKLSYEYPSETYEINVMGTINILEEIRKTNSVKIAIMITTDKCYENKEQLWGYRETDKLGGYDPYSSSKGAAEIAINSWRQSYFNPREFDKHGKAIASVRAGNVIGGGDWSKDRIIPDCIKAIEKDNQIEVRNPRSIRPWEHVLEPLKGYLMLGEKMLNYPTEFSEAWNFGPEFSSIIPVWDMASLLIEKYGKGKLIDVSNSSLVHEAKLLALDITKAKLRIGWSPILTLDQAIEFTADWYKKYSNYDVYNICLEQINYFMTEKNRFKI